MHFSAIDIVFQIIVFLFAISVHESAHAWMASRLGDPTARMLGRVSLNPIKHIDPSRHHSAAGYRNDHAFPGHWLGQIRRRWIPATLSTMSGTTS